MLCAQINFNNAFRNVSNKPAGAVERKGGADPFSRRNTRPSIYWNTGQQSATQVQGLEHAVWGVDTQGSVLAAGVVPLCTIYQHRCLAEQANPLQRAIALGYRFG